MFRHILLATDLSDASEHALEHAVGLASALRARLTVLCVYEVSASTLAGTGAAVAERTWPGGVRARAALDRIVGRLRARGIRVEGVLRFGSPDAQIIEVAAEARVDLIVTGRRRRKGFARLWYGSVAEQVVRASSVPVLAVPGGERGNVVRLLG